ncbi:MAG TPA: LLM class flavin-dependent oxidoreductase [Candidatus Tectomicrobia bacterium]|nr:LLM class flavin-dependent oxidoreductase [Candidatus Tectomicrobia bacterium]
MYIGIHLTPFFSPTDRPPTQVVDELVAIAQRASQLGFAWISAPHHWAAYPSVWPQPFPLLARLAPETGSMRLLTLVILLPLVNPVETAENVATLDAISHGRLTLGIAIGYREAELEAVGLMRKDRVPKLEESLALMKQLWSGEEVTFTGRYTRVAKLRMGLTPVQKPHPPIVMGCQSERATARAARLTDGVFFGPQVGWAHIGKLLDVYRRARAAAGTTSLGMVGASRALLLGKDQADAARIGRAYLERTFANYRAWDMQEATMVPLALSFDRPLQDWTVHGSPADCVETLLHARDAMGLSHISLTMYNLPRELSARLEYLDRVAEDIVRKVA